MSNQTRSEERPLPYGRIVVVKFREGTNIRLEREQLSSSTAEDLAGFPEVLNQFPGITVNRLFSRSERELEADRATATAAGTSLPDLNLFYRLDLPEDRDAVALVEALNGLPTVEMAYVEPGYTVASEVPSKIEEGMTIPAAQPAVPIICPPGPGNIICPPAPFIHVCLMPTPDFSGDQDYLNAAPTGIDALYAWTKIGGKGLNCRFADIEFGWNLSHEDLASASGATVYGTNTGSDHGTNVLGEIISGHNGIGVNGIAPEAQVGVLCSASDPADTIADCINHAAGVLAPGDVILIELQTWPGYKPVETSEANYVAIQAAVAAGIVVVEAAGNGSYDLDAYNRPASSGGGGFILRRSVRDSGAIIVGAGCPPSGTFGPDRSRWQYSNYGSRLDLQGQGREVCTTGDGALFDCGPNRRYNDDFRNTSAASPQVVGAALALQGISKAKTGKVLAPAQVRQALVDTGTAQQDGSFGPATQQIGPRPNLRAAIELLWPSICPPAPISIQCPPAPYVLCPPAPFICPPAPYVLCPPAPFICPPAPRFFQPPLVGQYGGLATQFGQYPATGITARSRRRKQSYQTPDPGYQQIQYASANPYGYQYLQGYGYPTGASGTVYGYPPNYGTGYNYLPNYGNYGVDSQTLGMYGAQVGNLSVPQQVIQQPVSPQPEGEFNPQMRGDYEES